MSCYLFSISSKEDLFLKALGVTTKFSIHFYSIEQSLAIFQGISDQLEILDLGGYIHTIELLLSTDIEELLSMDF